MSSQKKKEKRLYEAEFRVWVETPEPEEQPACGAIWPGAWNHADGVRPQCFRPEGHAEEHREIRKGEDPETWIDFLWGSDPGSGRREIHRVEP